MVATLLDKYFHRSLSITYVPNITNTYVSRLRNLAGDSCSAGGGGGGSLTTPRYQLAEHRYGREEMLALFDRTHKPPVQLESFTALYVPKAQLPLALIQMTEDETVRKQSIHFSIEINISIIFLSSSLYNKYSILYIIHFFVFVFVSNQKVFIKII
jgi:hypothetical protein